MDISLVKKTREDRRYKFTTPELLSEKETITAQIELGHHPYGYGRHNYKQTENGTTWYCWNNCD